MGINELLNELRELKNKKAEELIKRKKSINSNYEIAKLDFIAIENYNDSIETLRIVIEELEKLQERINKTNNTNI